jgi:hypothetical protein
MLTSILTKPAQMNWIISNPIDALQLGWDIVIKPCCLSSISICLLWLILARICKGKMKLIRSLCLSAMAISIIAVVAARVYQYAFPDLHTEPGHENYSAYFNDMQKRQIGAAQKYGITPIKDRAAAEETIKSGNLIKVTSCRDYQLAPMGHSIPYLTENAVDILSEIGRNFRDSLDSKGLCDHKIVVTSILRTDEDVERLMKMNNVAVKNSAHRYATTFDISYKNFVPVGLNLKVDRGDLKKVLAEVLRDLRNEKLCYVRYETSQSCFHITTRR